MIKKYLVLTLSVLTLGSNAADHKPKGLWTQIKETMQYGPVSIRDIAPTSVTNPEELIPAIDVAVENDKFKDAAKLMVEYKLRVHLDVSCCTDPSSAAAGDALTIRQWTNPKFAEIGEHVSREELKDMSLEAITKFEQQLATKAMPKPEWVGKYGMNKYLGCGKDGLFIPESKCREKQIELLKKYRTDLSE